MSHRLLRGACLAVLALILPVSSLASVTVDTALFSDSMVLQQQMQVPIWGTANPGEAVTVAFGSNQPKTTSAASDGTWMVFLDPMQAGGGGSDLTVSGNNAIVIHDVVVGEVWVCSGQSNMVNAVPPRSIRAKYTDVRTLNKSGWHDAPAGACFWFGANLNGALGIPIGLINRAVSGSWIALWLGNTAASDPDPEVQALLSKAPGWGGYYKHKIAPLEPYAVRGVAWWQGEKDVWHPAYYRHMLPALIRSWRREWGEGDFAFLFVQLPTGGGLKKNESPAPLPNVPATRDHVPPMRDAYIQALSEPNTGLVISIDLDGGEHPRDKQDYGQRFAMGGVGQRLRTRLRTKHDVLGAGL